MGDRLVTWVLVPASAGLVTYVLYPYPLTMTAVLVYSGEHYVIDL